jgi:metal-dependent hydrolase (beta-lactamase superfamily II)
VRFRVLGSGSSGNTTLIEAEGTRILIDAGLGPRELAERLQSAGVDPTSIAAVFLSHEHQDHAKGAASFSKKWGVGLVGSAGTYAAAGFESAGVSGWQHLESGATHEVGRLRVTAVGGAHPPPRPRAFLVPRNRQ